MKEYVNPKMNVQLFITESILTTSNPEPKTAQDISMDKVNARIKSYGGSTSLTSLFDWD